MFVTRYEYDAFGRRSAKITASGRTDYLWDGNQLSGEYSQSEYRWYLYEPGSNKPLALISGGQLYFYQLDQLGTPLSLTDSENKIVWQAHYSVFGKATVSVYKIDNPIRFQGQYFDNESGLHYNHFRYYDPQTGRFISQDPIGLLGGINHYQYAPNHINWVDPLGLSCKENAWNEFQKDHKGVFANSSAAAEAYRELIEGQSPWPIGYTPVQATLLPGSEFNMAYEPGQDIKWIGGFGTFDSIPNKSYVRNELAVKHEWKEDLDRVITFRVTKPLPVLLGPVGPQIDTQAHAYLSGGGSQIEMQVNPKNRGDYLDVVSVAPLEE